MSKGKVVLGDGGCDVLEDGTRHDPATAVDGQVNGQTFVKHSQELQCGDVWRMRVEAGRNAIVGFATEQCNVETDEEPYESIAWVSLYSSSKRPASTRLASIVLYIQYTIL